MRTAWVNLRHSVPKRLEAVNTGLTRHGYKPREGFTSQPKDGDLFITWNRIGIADQIASEFEKRGLPVLVLENATWGNDFAGESWYTLCRNYHNINGGFPVGDSRRWDELEIECLPWREKGETVVLLQRGIGPKRVSMPPGWGQQFKARIRRHPGRTKQIPLELDLAKCAKVITWGSGAAVKALMMGIKVESHLRNWIAEQDNTDAGRLAMFRRLAWAQWRLSEIEDGSAFDRFLN